MHRLCKCAARPSCAGKKLFKARLHVQVSEICLQAQYVQVEGREEHQALHIWTACVFNPLWKKVWWQYSHPRHFCSIFTLKTLFACRFGPYFCSPVIAGLEQDGTPYLCGMDTIGAIETAHDFMVAGTAPDSLYGMCESMWRPDLVSYQHQLLTSLSDQSCITLTARANRPFLQLTCCVLACKSAVLLQSPKKASSNWAVH